LHRKLADLLARYDVNEFAASVQVFAVKAEGPNSGAGSTGRQTHAKLQVFDRPMCCSTGVCGPSVDPALPRFAADLEWLKNQGVTVERFNLAQQPAAFAAEADVKEVLASEGTNALPLIRVNGRIVSRGVYPSRDRLATWAGVTATTSLPLAACCSSGTTDRC
jgi:hypothetical protein